MDFKEILKQKTEEVQAVIDKYLPEETGHQKTVLESMNYSVTVGGKRLRPMLMQETYRLFGGRDKDIELYHTFITIQPLFSLFHCLLPLWQNLCQEVL